MQCFSINTAKTGAQFWLCFCIQGNAGIGLSIVIVMVSVAVALTTALSAIGVCERCRMESGGVYFLMSHVMGGRIGGSLGIIYCFAQVSRFISI